MIQIYSRYGVLEQFFNFPRKAFLIREISRNAKLSQPSVRLHLQALLAEGLIRKEKGGLYPVFRANREHAFFPLLKMQNLVLRLHQTGTLTYLEKKLYPTCIVLFGSAARGEDTENSDIDLFLQAQSQKLDVKPFEKALNRKIAPLFEANIKKLGPELINTLANGIVLYGYLKVI